MIVLTSQGLYCIPGNFYIDPSGAVEHAVITHAHSDHARRGSRYYYCAYSGVSLLKQRLGQKISVTGINYNDEFYMGQVKVSLHPAGHILGSAQVRMEYGGEVWVASGDYKRDADPTCEPFETVPCDVFITEATFGTPLFKWTKDACLGMEIFEWWNENSKLGFNSVLFAYSLGKAQRILGELFPFAKRKIYCHAAATALNECYRSQGINLAPTICLSEVAAEQKLNGELLLVPHSFLKSDQASILGERFKTAFASGWIAQGAYGYDHGFVMSDHADWNDLLRTIEDTKAKVVYVQHRGNGALVRHLRNNGIKAYPDTKLIADFPNQLSLF